MKIVELTGENISKYIDGCLDTQQYLVTDQSDVQAEQFILTANTPHAYLIALVDGDRVAGLGVVNKIVHPVRTNAYIDNIVVHPDFRGQGLFRIIMDELERKAKEWGAAQTKLTCSREEVQPLYEKRDYFEKDTKYYCKDLNK